MKLRKTISGIPGVSDLEATGLRIAGIDTPATLESALDKGSASILGDLSSKSGIEETTIAQLLASSLQETAKPLKNSFAKDHWSDIVLLAIALLFALEIFRPWYSPLKPKPRVVAAVEIPAFTVIDSRQLRVEEATSSTEATEMMAAFVGKYTPEFVQKDAPLPNQIIHFQQTPISGRAILQLQVKSMPPVEGRPFPQNIELVFSPRDTGSPGATIPALLLAADASSRVVTVALVPTDAKEVAQWLGFSDIHVVWHLL